MNFLIKACAVSTTTAIFTVVSLFIQLARAADILEAEMFAISRGGQIYDNWMSALESDKPKSTHALYPKSGK
ncbi:MAG: hypothetical protein VW268_14450 [Rhodospirillaceae bacterium]